MYTRLIGLLALLTPVAVSAQEFAPPWSPPPQAPTPERTFAFDGRAYILAGRFIAVQDLSSPTSYPKGRMGYYRGQGYTRWITSLGNHRMTFANGAITTIDFSNPRYPRMVGVVPSTPGYSTHYVHAAPGPNRSTRLYATEYRQASDWQLTIHTNTRIGPRRIGSFPIPSSSSASTALVTAVGTRYVVVSSYTVGVFVLDVSNPAQVRQVSSMNVRGVTGMTVQGRRLFLRHGVGFSSSMLQIWDLTTPGAPRREGLHPIRSAAYDSNGLVVQRRRARNFAFMTGAMGQGYSSEELIAADVSDPTRPGRQKVVSLRHPAGFDVIPWDVDVVGNVAWVSGWRRPGPPNFRYDYYLVRVDISRPLDPRITGFTRIPINWLQGPGVPLLAQMAQAGGSGTTLAALQRHVLEARRPLPPGPLALSRCLRRIENLRQILVQFDGQQQDPVLGHTVQAATATLAVEAASEAITQAEVLGADPGQIAVARQRLQEAQALIAQGRCIEGVQQASTALDGL